MDNSFHSDNSICPINIISQVLSFLASFRSRQIQRPSPLKIVPDLYSAVLCVLQIGRVRANADLAKTGVQSECNWQGEAWLKNENKVGKGGQMTVTECYLLMSRFQI